MSARVRLIGKPGCHLCDEARDVVAAVCAEFAADWAEESILDDPALADSYFELIPVLLVDDVQVCHWWIDEAALRRSLEAG